MTAAPKPKKPRKQPLKEWKRKYHSKARVEWVQGHRCAGCCWVPSENAHTENEGKSRKGSYKTIAPLCGNEMGLGCHFKYDNHICPFDNKAERERMKDVAADTERRWVAYQEGAQ